MERVTTPDGDHVTLLRMGRASPAVPHLLVLHGLEATVRATYAHGLLAAAASRGWTGDLLMFRSCDGELNLAPRLYHSGETGDVEHVARRLVAERKGAPILVVGVSLGGNVLLKWLGERGVEAGELVAAAVAVSVPFDLAAGSRHLEHGIARLYARHFLRTLRAKALAKAAQHPGLLDPAAIDASRTFWEFDDAATAPLHGFRNAADYYARASSIHFLERVHVPTLLFSAEDDPIVPLAVLREAERIVRSSSVVSISTTRRGGHVGWVTGSPLSPAYYMESHCVEILGQMAQ